MNEQIVQLQQEFEQKLAAVTAVSELEEIRIAFLGKNGSVTGLMKQMGKLSPEEKKSFGQQVNQLKTACADRINEKQAALAKEEMEREINSMPEFDVAVPPVLARGSYHPITLVQRKCEKIFRSMGFTVEDYSEVVTD